MDDSKKKKILGLRIMQRRKQLGIKQSELAELMGVSDNQVSNIENGKCYPKFGNFILLCETLKCNADYFLSGILRDNAAQDAYDMLSLLTVEEQKTVWKLLDCYIHGDDL